MNFSRGVVPAPRYPQERGQHQRVPWGINVGQRNLESALNTKTCPEVCRGTLQPCILTRCERCLQLETDVAESL